MAGTDARPPLRAPDSGHYKVVSDAGGRRAAAIAMRKGGLANGMGAGWR